MVTVVVVDDAVVVLVVVVCGGGVVLAAVGGVVVVVDGGVEVVEAVDVVVAGVSAVADLSSDGLVEDVVVYGVAGGVFVFVPGDGDEVGAVIISIVDGTVVVKSCGVDDGVVNDNDADGGEAVTVGTPPAGGCNAASVGGKFGPVVSCC